MTSKTKFGAVLELPDGRRNFGYQPPRRLHQSHSRSFFPDSLEHKPGSSPIAKLILDTLVTAPIVIMRSSVLSEHSELALTDVGPVLTDLRELALDPRPGLMSLNDVCAGLVAGGELAPPGLVDGGELAPPGLVDGGELAPPGLVDGGELAPPGLVDGDELAPPGLVDGGELAPGLVDGGELAPGLVDGGELAPGLVDGGELAPPGLVDGGELAPGLVDGGELAPGLVDGGELAPGLVDGGELAPGLVDGGELAPGLVDGGELAPPGLVRILAESWRLRSLKKTFREHFQNLSCVFGLICHLSL